MKICVVCGRRIPDLSIRKTTCDEFCRKRYKAGYAPYKGCTEPPFNDLTAVQKEAQRLGMSYGEYVSMKSQGR